LTGLGISFTMGYLIYLIQIYCVSKHYFKFSFEKDFCTLFFILSFITFLTFLSVFLLNPIFKNILGLILIIFVLVFSFREIDKRIAVTELIRIRKNRFINDKFK
jgi:hypothetical protein